MPRVDLALSRTRPTPAQRFDDAQDLIVEVSVGTLRHDRTTLALHYARHGVRDYWVIDPKASVVHVFREPRTNATEFAEAYASERQVGLDGVVAPLADESKTIRVADFMPTAGALPDETA